MRVTVKVAAIITAAGVGRRLDAQQPKPYLQIAGQPLICHALDRFRKVHKIERVIIVVQPERVATFQQILQSFDYPSSWQVVAGGEQRQDSVRNGLQAVPEDFDIVLVHDGARPFISPVLIERSIDVAATAKACIVAVPLKETLKLVEGQDIISKTVDRNLYWAAQTPQTFHLNLLRQALDAAYRDNFYGTDEAMLVERLGHPVKVIRGDYRNIKITTPEDLLMSETLAKNYASF